MARHRRRRRRGASYRVLGGLLIVTALLVAFSLTSGLFFKIAAIEVEGLAVYTEAQIRQTAGFQIGDNIFLVNKTPAIRAIRSRYPYVDDVTIRRRLPGTVIISVTEKAPVGMIELEGRLWLFDGQGIVLESVSAVSPPAYPLVRGVNLLAPLPGTTVALGEADEPKIQPMLALLSAFQAAGIHEDVRWVDIMQISNVVFGYTDRFQVELGLPEDIGRKLEFMLEGIKLLDPYETGTIKLHNAISDHSISIEPGTVSPGG